MTACSEMAAVRRAAPPSAVVNDSHFLTSAARGGVARRLRRLCAAVHRTQARRSRPARSRGRRRRRFRPLWEAEQRHSLLLAPRTRRGGPTAPLARQPRRRRAPRRRVRIAARESAVGGRPGERLAAASGSSKLRVRWRRPTTSRTAAAAATTTSAAAAPAAPARGCGLAAELRLLCRSRRPHRRCRDDGVGVGGVGGARRRRRRGRRRAAAAAGERGGGGGGGAERAALVALLAAGGDRHAAGARGAEGPAAYPADAAADGAAPAPRARPRSRAAAAAAAAATGSRTRRCSSATPRSSECSCAPGRRRPMRAAGRVESSLDAK